MTFADWLWISLIGSWKRLKSSWLAGVGSYPAKFMLNMLTTIQNLLIRQVAIKQNNIWCNYLKIWTQNFLMFRSLTIIQILLMAMLNCMKKLARTVWAFSHVCQQGQIYEYSEEVHLSFLVLISSVVLNKKQVGPLFSLFNLLTTNLSIVKKFNCKAIILIHLQNIF